MEGFDILINEIHQFLQKFTVFKWFQLKSSKGRDVSIRRRVDDVIMMFTKKKTEQMIVMVSILLSN